MSHWDRQRKSFIKKKCKGILTISLYEFRTEQELYQTVEEFAYVTYNHIRPHSYNSYRTPCQARMAA